MSMSDVFNTLIAQLEQLIASCVNAQRTSDRAQGAQAALKQIVGLLLQIMQSPVAEELGEVVHQRVQRVLDQIAGEPLLEVALAEYLRGHIQALEASARKLVEASQEAGAQAARGCPARTPDQRLADSIVEVVGILGDKLETVQRECAALPLIIPGLLDALAARMQISVGVIAPATTPATGTAVAVVPAAGGASVPHRYWTHRGKAQALRCEAHQFGSDLLASLNRHRGEIDDAQGGGWYNPVTLRAVAVALCALAAKAHARGEALVAHANARVRL